MYNYNQKNQWTETTKKDVWNKGKIIPGYKPDIYRQDLAGAWIKWDDYGNINSDYGWEIDHIYPESKGGSDDLSNLKPLQWANNRSKGDNYPLFTYSISSLANKNIVKEQNFNCN